MKKVVLLFPDTVSLADFVLKHQIRGAEVRSCEHILIATLTGQQLSLALKEYGAETQKVDLTGNRH